MVIDPERAAEAAKRLAVKINNLPQQAVILSLLGQRENKPINLIDDGTAVLILARGTIGKLLMEAIYNSSTQTEVEKVRLKPKPEEPHQN